LPRAFAGANLDAMADSPFNPVSLRRARALLAAPPARSHSLAALTGAAAFFAVSAIALAATVVMLPTPWPK
jgi:hypothetical protein